MFSHSGLLRATTNMQSEALTKIAAKAVGDNVKCWMTLAASLLTIETCCFSISFDFATCANSAYPVVERSKARNSDFWISSIAPRNARPIWSLPKQTVSLGVIMTIGKIKASELCQGQAIISLTRAIKPPKYSVTH